MRIPLSISGDINKKRLVLVGFFKYKRLGIVKFLIDTGSPISFLCPADTLRLQINQKALNFDASMTIGGGTLSYAKVKNVSLEFRDAERNRQIFEFDEFSVTSHRGSGGADISILGLDFLSDKKLTVNLPNNEAYIEY